MDRMLPPAAMRGLTLIELMIALAILCIAAMASAPDLRQLIHGNRLRVEAARLITAVSLARNEAIARNQPVSLCPSPMAASGETSCSGSYADGWIVFANADRDRQFDAGRDEIIRAFAGLPPGYTLTNRSGTRVAARAITYLPDGSARGNQTLLVCAPVPHLAPWGVVLNIVGRARLSRGEGKCPVAPL